VLKPVYSDTTQLDVELSCVGEVSIATPTQLNLTNLLRGDWLYAVQLGKLHCQLDVELSCVAINGPLVM